MNKRAFWCLKLRVTIPMIILKRHNLLASHLHKGIYIITICMCMKILRWITVPKSHLKHHWDPDSCIYSFFCIFYFFNSVTIVCIFPYPSTPPQPIPLPSPTSTLPLDFVLVSFIVAPVDLSPHYPLPTPLWLLLHFS